MDVNALVSLGKIAGIGGIAIGAVVFIFRDIIRKNIFPKLDNHHAYNIIRIILFLTWSIGVIGIVSYVYIKKDSIDEESPQRKEIPIPGGTGWVYLGEYDESLNGFIKDPYFKVSDSKYPDKSIFPRKGESIRLTRERRVVIADFKESGTVKWNVPPWQQNVLDSNDYTGVILPKDTELEVRDISMGQFKGMPYVVWVRVALLPR